MPQEVELELLSIRQLKLVAETQPQAYRIRVQVDLNAEKETAQGKPYREVKLVDGADFLVWRVFDGNPAFTAVVALKPGKWIELSAQWIDTGKFGLDPKNAVLRFLEDEEVQALLGGDALTRERQQADYADITSFISQISDPRLRGLGRLFLEVHGERFRRAAAARDYHHARRGGLVEHVSQMMRSAVKICEAYPSLNRDLLVAGVLFHDCGKLWENNYGETSFTMPYSLHGEMVGHISLGMELVNKLWRQLMEAEEAKAWAIVDPSNELVRVHLLHLIGSHHGEMQFGSPVLPRTPEAIVLHHVDNIDAKLEMFRRGYDSSREIGTGIFERVRPLPANLVLPLPRVAPEEGPAGEEGNVPAPSVS
jgi:3'-5' exoribonuclease